MIAADTNVLVRYLVADDAGQAAAATEALEGAEAVVISVIVLCELVWVLKGAYGYDRSEIARTVRGLIESAGVAVDRPMAEAGLAMIEAGGDFADGVILAEAERAGAGALVTFDRRFAAHGGERVKLLLPAEPENS